jgi:hypothetical protein
MRLNYKHGINSQDLFGSIELYKNGHRIRDERFNKRSMRNKLMKIMLEYSNTHLNYYHFIIKIDN